MLLQVDCVGLRGFFSRDILIVLGSDILKRHERLGMTSLGNASIDLFRTVDCKGSLGNWLLRQCKRLVLASHSNIDTDQVLSILAIGKNGVDLLCDVDCKGLLGNWLLKFAYHSNTGFDKTLSILAIGKDSVKGL
ncbi:hypothetical protein ACHAO2_002649 [Verticillium nonalfalfae]